MKLISIILLFLSFNVSAQQAMHAKRGIGNNAQAPNLPPNVDAGVDKAITLPANSVTFFGSGSDSYGSVTFQWVQISGPSTAILTGATTATLLAGTLIEGTYLFELTVTDNKGLASVDTTSVIVNPAINVLPVANAGSDIPLTLPTNSTGITGTATDADGTISSVLWTHIGGPSTATITGETTLTPTVSNLIEGTYDFRLLVTDNSGGTDSDIMRVIVSPIVPPVNQPPVADAGSNIVITLPTNSTTLTGSGTDPDGTIVSYSWELLTGTGGVISSPSSATTGLTSLTQGVRTYQLTVTDNLGATDTDIVQVTVLGAVNVGPTALAGSDQSITLPTNQVTLTGSGTDTDGTIVSYLWTKQSGPVTSLIVSQNSATTVVSFIEAGVYVFQLKVTDNNGASGFDAVQITVVAAATINTGAITFSLDTISHVSAGVYNYSSDSTLIATLFSDSIMSAGSHTIYWKGYDDTLKYPQFPASKYIVKILSNNVKYDWMGTIGNNSDSVSGETKHRGYYRCMSTLCFTSTHGYYATGYSEGSPSLAKFAIGSPGTKISMPYGSLINTGDIGYNCTDGTNVYWAFFDSNAPNNSAVFATKVLDDTEVQFAAGSVFNGVSCRDYPYAISITNQSNARPSGLAVGSSYLFVARAGADQLKVHNKTSGALVQTLTMDSVRGIATDQSGNLWAITGASTVSKYPINVDGSLGAATLTLSGQVHPLSINVNQAGTVVSVTNGSTSQQVKHYNNSTGVLSSTLGELGGYYNGAVVRNSKFFMTDLDGTPAIGENQKYHFVAYQSDGSYWVSDPGNYRVQKFSAAHSFVRNLMWLGSSLGTCIDPGNINRVFWKFLEFDVNYSTGEWSLVRNWMHKVSTGGYARKYGAKFKTLSNGRTYALIGRNSTAEILELSTAGGDTSVRFTGILKSPGYFLEPDGSLIRYLRGNYGATSTMQRFALTGFSGGNPTWAGTPTVLFTTPVLTKYDANAFPVCGSSIITSTGKVITFDGGAARTSQLSEILDPKDGFHLQAIQQGGNTWKWKTQLGTHLNYKGAYPDMGRFDVGNLVNDFAGGGMSISERNIFTNYHGEGWKNGQTGYHQHYLDNGLAIGIFGTDRSVVGTGVHAAAKMAGNTLTPHVVKETNGNLYLVHGDESDHSALHLWEISRMNTIRQQEVVINYPSAYVTPAQNFTELSGGLPFNDTLANNTAGWTKSPVYNNTTSIYTDYFKATTRVTTYKKDQPSDINAVFAATYNSTKTISRDMGTINATNDWKVTGNISWAGEANNAGIGTYIRVLDVTGKVLARFYIQSAGTGSATTTTVRGNGSAIVSGLKGAMSLITSVSRPFSITYQGGNITFVYDNYTPVVTTKFDATASGLQPKTLQIYFLSQTGLAAMDNKTINLGAPRIYVDIL